MLHCNTDTHTHTRTQGSLRGNRTCNLERPVALGKVVGGGEKKGKIKEMLLLQVLLDLRVVNEPAI